MLCQSGDPMLGTILAIVDAMLRLPLRCLAMLEVPLSVLVDSLNKAQ
jgi:hypothetical protein